MKTFKQFLEQTQLPSNYTDYKAPAVQAAHARGMQSASKMRQMGMNAKAIDPKDEAQANLDSHKPGGRGVAKPLSGTRSYSPLKKRLTGDGKVVTGGSRASSGVTIEQVKTGQTTLPDGTIESEFTYPNGRKVKVRQTKAERDAAARINQERQPQPGQDTLW